jgi:hypothetical protein
MVYVKTFRALSNFSMHFSVLGFTVVTYLSYGVQASAGFNDFPVITEKSFEVVNIKQNFKPYANMNRCVFV